MDKGILNILIQRRINNVRHNLHINNVNFGVTLLVIFTFLFIIIAIFVPKEMFSLLFVFPILSVCVALIVEYNRHKIEEMLDYFENDLELYITGRSKYEVFEKIIKDLDRNKYHICREVDEDGYIKNWYIFRKDMSIDKYFSAENKPLLTSKENDIFDLINFVKEE